MINPGDLGQPFTCEKLPANGSRGMVVTNHPQASAAGAQMLLRGGNAIDAAIASLFALTVVEPMMVGILGGGVAHIRLASGHHVIVDGLSTASLSATPDMFGSGSTLLSDRANVVGPKAVATPGALAGWCETLEKYGSLSLSDVLEPAVRLAERGFTVTPYLSDCIKSTRHDLAADPGLAALFMPDGEPIEAGSILRQTDYALTLRTIAAEGSRAFYSGPLGRAFISHMASNGGLVDQKDLEAYRVVNRDPVRGQYRDYEIVGPPPPSSSGVHIVQMLNILEGFDIAGMGFGSADATHLLAEALKIAFADRAVATADPAFFDVPLETLIDKGYAAERREKIDPSRAQTWSTGLQKLESANTTHVSVADSFGNVVSTTQTINGLFGACVQIPGTGMIANNYMYNFDPCPGSALSIEPGKRVFTSMAPMMAYRGNRLQYTLGLPGGLRIFPSAMQALVNLIDHKMSIQQAVEAPRVWTEGGVLEIEPMISDATANELADRGHTIVRANCIAGGMSAIEFHENGTMTGAACWRADGTPVAISGGLARDGVRFSIP
ncbi:gamma-glutamyltransferase [Agrobacterium vitis]|nr:gamma-glutamyltransferase [Agrobacterium vitis]